MGRVGQLVRWGLIPASGFYEWAAIAENGKIRKQPYYVHPSAPDGLFAFFGLLAAWKSPAGETIVSTCIITTGANAVMAPIHDRMPVILPPEQQDAWLDPDNQDVAALQALIGPCSSELMHAYLVSPAINSGRIEGSECIAPIELR